MGGLGTQHTTLEAYRNDLLALLSSNALDALKILRTNVRKYILAFSNPIQRQEPNMLALEVRLEDCQSLHCLMGALMTLCKSAPPSIVNSVQRAISRSNYRETLKYLRTIPPPTPGHSCSHATPC